MDSDFGFQYEFIDGMFYTCSVCHYAWKSRGVAEPRSCPRCGTRLWKESYRHDCVKCGYSWMTSRPAVKKCPSCQSSKWNETVRPVAPVCQIDKDVAESINIQYRKGKGAVAISIFLSITFSDVYDVLKCSYPDGEISL